MNERIQKLAEQAKFMAEEDINRQISYNTELKAFAEKFAELLIEEVLNEVKERAYYTGDRDWSDEVDRPWIQLEFGYGSLHDAKLGVGK